MQIEIIINNQLQRQHKGEITFRQACHNIDQESNNYKLVNFDDKIAVFEAIKAKRKFSIRNL